MTTAKSSAPNSAQEKQVQYRQSLGQQVNTIEQEARMVLPGIQALFGFQLVAVFNQGFKANLNDTQQLIHLVALIMVAISAVLVLTPAAYHRQANHQISQHFAELASGLLAWALAPLAIGTSLDIYVVSWVVLHSECLSWIVAGLMFALFAWCWFIFPQLRGRKIRLSPGQNAAKKE